MKFGEYASDFLVRGLMLFKRSGNESESAVGRR